MYNLTTNQLIDALTKKYYPFNLLSPERLEKVNSIMFHQVGNMVRFIELRQGEMMQILGSKDNDYLFVVSGSIDLIQPGLIQSDVSPTKVRKEPLVLLAEPATSTVVARKNCIFCHFERDFFDDLIAWDEIFSLVNTNESNQYIEHMLNCAAFRRIPLECVEEAYRRMSRKTVKKGDIIIEQGEKNDCFYLLIEGSATAYQDIKNDFSPELDPIMLITGDVFGDENLVADCSSEKTIRMRSDGILLVLQDSDFHELVGQQLIRQVHPSIVKSMIDTGYKLIDVRYDIEHEESNIPGSVLIPLHELRDRMHELDKTEQYVVYCRSGKRSAAAVMMLRQNKYEAISLEGGTRDWPYEMTN